MAIKNQYFLKDKKAQPYKMHDNPDETDDDGFPLPPYYTPISPAPIWCYTRQLSQDQIIYAMTYHVEETRYFVFNYRKDIAVYDPIFYDGQWYEVTRVDYPEDYNRETFVYVKYREKNPDSNAIKPYGYVLGN